jgi:hypothetical protein
VAVCCLSQKFPICPLPGAFQFSIVLSAVVTIFQILGSISYLSFCDTSLYLFTNTSYSKFVQGMEDFKFVDTVSWSSKLLHYAGSFPHSFLSKRPLFIVDCWNFHNDIFLLENVVKFLVVCSKHFILILLDCVLADDFCLSYSITQSKFSCFSILYFLCILFLFYVVSRHLISFCFFRSW